MDTSEVSGKPILNVSVKEKLSTAYFRRSPHAEKEFVKVIKRDFRRGKRAAFSGGRVQGSRHLRQRHRHYAEPLCQPAVENRLRLLQILSVGHHPSRRRQMYRTQFCTVQQPHVRILRPHLRAARRQHNVCKESCDERATRHQPQICEQPAHRADLRQGPRRLPHKDKRRHDCGILNHPVIARALCPSTHTL